MYSIHNSIKNYEPHKKARKKKDTSSKDKTVNKTRLRDDADIVILKQGL